MLTARTFWLLVLLKLVSTTTAAQDVPMADDPDQACAQAYAARRFQPMAAAYFAGQRLPGVVAAAQMQSLAAPEAAEVQTIFVRPGQTVRGGQVLVSLRAPELSLAMDAADSARQQAEQERIKQREELHRIELSLKRRQKHPNLFARDELDALAASAVAAKAALSQAESRLSLSTRTWQDWQRRLDALTLRAPNAGQVVAILVRPGMRIGLGAELLQWHSEQGANEIRFAMPIARAMQTASGWCVALSDVGSVLALTSVRAEAERWPSAEVQVMSARTRVNLDWPRGAGVDVFPLNVESAP